MCRMLIALLIVCLFVSTASALPGSGTQSDPWRIQSLSDFDEFAADANYWAGYTRLKTDVNLAGRIYTTAVIAHDINNLNYVFDGSAFTGIFDGNGKRIINLTIDDGGAGNYYLGLFGYIDDGEVRNLGLEGGSISGDRYVGGLAGYVENSSISNCYSTGSVSGTYHIGGLVGNNDGGSVSNCHSAGDVSGYNEVGGLVGENWDRGSILNCYSTADVTGHSKVGGLVGGNGGSVSNCYSTGDVSGYDEVGGLVGLNTFDVSNCFWDIETQTHDVTESIGLNYGGTITNVSGLTTIEMQTKSTFIDAGWDFIDESTNGTSETWQMPSGGGYPVLSVFHIDIPVPLAGSGTVNDPYLVNDANELGMVSWYSADCHFKLTGDIDLSGIHWSVAVVPAFNGCFDGEGHKVLNMQISGGGHLGLFGYLRNNGQIRGLCIDGGSVNGTSSYIGGLVGYNQGGYVSNCNSACDVDGVGGVGGLVGANEYGRVWNCYSTGSVTGNSTIGGSVGANWYGFVLNCCSSGDVSGNDNVGGLMGGNGGIVSNCYSTGCVTGNRTIGGLVGSTWDGFVLNCFSAGDVIGGWMVGGLVGRNSGSFSNCYSTGDVRGDEDVGGLVGENWGDISNCFWDTDTQTHGVTDSIGDNRGTATNVAGLPTTLMQTKSTFTEAGWDFIGARDNGTTETWQMPAGSGYPVLSVFHIDIPVPLAGSGTVNDPYLVNDADELGMVSWYPAGCHFKLTGDIDLSGIIWSVAVVPLFNGCFDGTGHRVLNMQISGGGYLGLFGYLEAGGQVKNLGLESSSVRGCDYVGGLVGYNSYGSVSNCYSSGDVNGVIYVGGLVGDNRGSISKCYSTGDVNGERYVGGLVGDNRESISNCYSASDVNGFREVGGLVGLNRDSISNCYSTSNVSGAESCVGGLVGNNWEIISNCHSTGDVSGYEHVGGLVGYNNYNGSVSNCYSTGDVNGEIYIGGLVGLNGDSGNVSNCCSTGSVIGSSRVGGLVGYNREIISNCYSTGDVSGDERVGGLVGYNLYGSVSNCFSTGDITGGEFISGLVGYNHHGSILNCCSIGSVSGVQDVGGLVGYNRFGSILNCCSIGSVSGYSHIGGLMGGNDYYGSVSNSYSAGSVSGYSYVGGLVGENEEYGSISNCYSTVDVNGVGYVGGLVGCNHSYVSNCFWDTDTQTHGVTRGIGLNPGGTINNVLGLTTTEMQIKSTFTDAGWDFTTPIWTIDEGVDYPRLWWELAPVMHAEPEITLWTSNTVSWEPVIGGVEYYAECAEDVNFDNIVYNSGWITEASYEFTGLQLEQRYWYRVKARNSAGMESQWSNVESSLQGTLAEVLGIELAPESLKNENLKAPYINKINIAQDLIENGNFTSALNKLENDILQKTDGCAETGEPDDDDWIITCEEQSEVYSLIIETIDYVKSLMQ